MGTIKRLAGDIMGVGTNRVRINPDGFKEADKAMTRGDVRDLIKKGIVTKIAKKGRLTNDKKKKRGAGSRKGARNARRGDKETWMMKVRAQRKSLIMLLADGALPKENKREIYNKVKSGMFKSKRAMLAYLKEAKMVKQEYEPKKEERRTAKTQ
jgi:large subunit ribosomal protein L19e